MKIIICTLFISLIAFSCHSLENDTFQIDPRTFNDNKITLADIADDIKYIPLNDSLPIGMTFGLRITADYIYISVKDIGILQFDRLGNLIQKIGARGRGPGEYQFGMEFAVDEKTGSVYIRDPKNVYVYSQGGLFLREISYQKYLATYPMAGAIEFYNSLIFLGDYLMRGNSSYNWIFLDTLGNLISAKENSVPLFQTNVGWRGCVYKFENKLFYYNVLNDTVFSITPELFYSKAYLFAKGEHRWPRTKIETNTFDLFTLQISKLFQPLKMFETKRFIVLSYIYLDKSAISFFDKNTKKTFLSYRYERTKDNKEYRVPCLINDLDGGPPLENINYYSENSKEFITTIINPLNLKEHLESDGFRKTFLKYPEKKKELEKLANSLKETDNPVLMIVRLKK